MVAVVRCYLVVPAVAALFVPSALTHEEPYTERDDREGGDTTHHTADDGPDLRGRFTTTAGSAADYCSDRCLRRRYRRLNSDGGSTVCSRRSDGDQDCFDDLGEFCRSGARF